MRGGADGSDSLRADSTRFPGVCRGVAPHTKAVPAAGVRGWRRDGLAHGRECDL